MSDNQQSDNKPKFVIVGAGPAGAIAANQARIEAFAFNVICIASIDDLHDAKARAGVDTVCVLYNDTTDSVAELLSDKLSKLHTHISELKVDILDTDNYQINKTAAEHAAAYSVNPADRKHFNKRRGGNWKN